MVIKYSPTYLDHIPTFTEEFIVFVQEANNSYSLEKLLSNGKSVEALSIDFIHASAQIEGNTYTKIDTATLLLEGQTAGGKQYSDARMILNLRNAFSLLLSGNFMVTQDFLFTLHSEVCNGELQNSELGRVRSEPVLITGTSYVPALGEEYLHGELKYLFEVLNKIDCPLKKSIYSHLNLAYLQYFKDGNKRTARLFQNAIMMKAGLIPMLFDESAVSSYRSSLIEYYETGNSDSYCSWFEQEYRSLFDRLIPYKPEPRKN